MYHLQNPVNGLASFRVLVAHLVEHPPGVWKVMGSNPNGDSDFFRVYVCFNYPFKTCAFVSHLTKLNIYGKVSKIHFGSLLRLVFPQLRSKKRVRRGESFRGGKIKKEASSHFRAFPRRESNFVLTRKARFQNTIPIVFPTT